MGKKSFDDVMDTLHKVPGVTEHLNKFSVLMAEEIVKKRYELGLTQQDVVEIINNSGETMTQSSLSKIESGDENIKSASYNKVLNALGGLNKLNPEFKEDPRSKTLISS